MSNNRRDFLKSSALVGAGSLVANHAAADAARKIGAERGVQAYKRLGRTELQISDISFGSSRLRTGQERLVHHAMDLGINYIDSAEELHTRTVGDGDRQRHRGQARPGISRL